MKEFQTMTETENTGRETYNNGKDLLNMEIKDKEAALVYLQRLNRYEADLEGLLEAAEEDSTEMNFTEYGKLYEDLTDKYINALEALRAAGSLNEKAEYLLMKADNAMQKKSAALGMLAAVI